MCFLSLAGCFLFLCRWPLLCDIGAAVAAFFFCFDYVSRSLLLFNCLEDCCFVF